MMSCVWPSIGREQMASQADKQVEREHSNTGMTGISSSSCCNGD